LKIPNFLKNRYFWIIFAITVLGVFLRIYKHADLLFFEVDQARDWRTVEIAFQNGAKELPLMGPGMNASTFRIGPIYHYIQYLSALLFGNTPNVLAYPDLLFSVLTIPLFYLFLREYFSKAISLSLALIFACSLFAVQHGRFAMNSNSLPFFMLLALYPLLRFSREENKSKKWFWVILSSFSFGIAIQLHALTLFVLPPIIFVYLFLAKAKLSLKQVLTCIIVVITLNLPIVFNEIMSGFESISGFRSGLSMREESRKNFSFAKRIIRNSQEIARSYVLIISSEDIVPSLDPDLKPEGGLDMLERNFSSSSGKIAILLSILTILFFFAPFFHLFRKYLGLKNEKEAQAKKNFIILILIWQLAFLPVYLFILYTQHARYYLPVIFIPYVILGIYLDYIRKKAGKAILFLVAFVVLAINLFFVAKWFNGIEKYSSPDITPEKIEEYIQDPFYIVTLNQIEAADSYIENIYSQDGKEIFLIAPKQFYARPMRFLMIWEKSIPVRVFSSGIRDKNKNYILVNSIDTPLEEINLIYKDFANDFEAVDQKSFGTLYVIRYKIKDSVTHRPSSDFEISTSNENSQDNDHLVKKYTWNQFFSYIREK
jgi:4-amino-4-deoxy-L-arabinose transferase-like glycosyltransferase